MTDYAKHIEALEPYYPRSSDPVTTALTAAIELMRSAAPKDAEAEREVCLEYAECEEHPVDTVERARAEARAEGYATAKAALHEMNPDQLSAAQVEIARLREDNEKLNTWGPLRRLNDEWTAVESTLKAEIDRVKEAHAADADRMLQGLIEIERLRAELADAAGYTKELGNKLLSLRAAAERTRVMLQHSGASFGMLAFVDAAIKASR